MTQNESTDNARERANLKADIRNQPNIDTIAFRTCKQTIHNISEAMLSKVDWNTFNSDSTEIKAIDELLRNVIVDVNNLKDRPIARRHNWDFIVERLVFALKELSRARELASNTNVQTKIMGGDMKVEDKYDKMANCWNALNQAEREMGKTKKSS